MIDLVRNSDDQTENSNLTSSQTEKSETAISEEQLLQLSASWQSYRPIIERRRHPRLKYSAPVRVVPINNDSGQPGNVLLEAIGRDLSEQGISFTHTANIAERKVLICLGQGEVTKVYRVDLRWSRYCGNNEWTSGGYFERTFNSDDAGWNKIENCFLQPIK